MRIQIPRPVALPDRFKTGVGLSWRRWRSAPARNPNSASRLLHPGWPQWACVVVRRNPESPLKRLCAPGFRYSEKPQRHPWVPVVCLTPAAVCPPQTPNSGTFLVLEITIPDPERKIGQSSCDDGKGSLYRWNRFPVVRLLFPAR